jgi:hypothetical protein
LKRQAKAILAALQRGPLWTNDLRAMGGEVHRHTVPGGGRTRIR